MQKRRRRVDFTNNWMFGRVMTDESICRDVIRAVLGIEAVRIDYLNAEQVLDPAPESHGVRMDVYARERGSGGSFPPGTTTTGCPRASSSSCAARIPSGTTCPSTTSSADATRSPNCGSGMPRTGSR